MANYDKEIFDLEQVLGYLGRPVDYEKESHAPAILNLGLSYYHEYFKIHKKIQQTPAFAQDFRIKNYLDFQRLIAPTQINDIISFFRHLGDETPEENQKIQKVEKKEDSTVPAELETLVALYKQSQADQLSSDHPHEVAAAVKRARKTWAIKHQADLIRENRLALIQDKTEREKQREIEDLERDLFLVQTVDPKADSARTITQNIEKVSRQAVIAQAANLGLGLTEKQISQAVDEIKELSISGALNFDTDFKGLNVVSQLTLRNLGLAFDSPINKIDDKVIAWQNACQKDPYSDKPEEIDKDINAAAEESERYFTTSSKNLFSRLNRKNPDIKDHLEGASKELVKIQSSLVRAIPQATLPSASPSPLHQNFNLFESALRQADPQLRINPIELSSQAAGILEITGETREVSPEAVRLLGLGLTTARFAEIEKKALANPASPIGRLYQTHQDVFHQVRFQIKKLSGPNSKIGQEIAKSLKPLGSLSGSLASFYNTHPGIQTVAKIALDPVGSAKSWASRQAGKRVGKHLIENSSHLLAKKFGGFLLEHGLKDGVSAFTKAAAKKALVKAATWAALKLGISLSAESLNAIMPGLGLLVDVAAQILVYVAEKTIGWAWEQYKSFYREINGKEFEWKDALRPVVALGGLAVSAGASAFGGLVLIVRTTQVAIVSAVGIVIGAVVTVGLYLGFAYLVAPMLSTLVQLDSVEKVNYEDYAPIITPSGDCAWPTKGHYPINTGPKGGTHYKNRLEAIDIGAPDKSPFLSATSGVVTFTGVYSNYGNTVIVQTKNAAGSFTVYYAHLSAIFVGNGQQIAQGKPVGLVGGSGGWSPHIHLEYKGIKYNQCPAGGLKIKEGCCTYSPAPACSGACNAFSN